MAGHETPGDSDSNCYSRTLATRAEELSVNPGEGTAQRESVLQIECKKKDVMSLEASLS